ncbi:hypothetical protein I4U23_023709 [Adineta vaga]|nr:hypothetical protein I4U23_023709 [Adineta vaga]
MQYSQPPPYTEKTPYPQAQPPPASAPAPVYAAPMYAPPVVGSYPVQCVCPHCRQQVVTQTVKKNGLLAWLLCGGMTLVGLWLCCLYPTESKPNAPSSYAQSVYPSQSVPMATTANIQTQVTMYKDIPIQCICPYCRTPILTRIEKKTGVIPWIVCTIIAFAGGFCGCCFIPFCINGLKDSEHYCPKCQVLLGVGTAM